LAIPASLGLILLRKPIIILLYQRGAFNAYSTQLVAWALLWYALGLIGHCAVEILARSFYAMHDTRTPVIVGTLAMGLNVGFSYLFSGWFLRLGWMPHGGLALANSVATALEMLGLFYLMRRQLGGLEEKAILKATFQALLASVGMGAILLWWLQAMGSLHVFWLSLGGIGLGGAVYFILGWISGNYEIRSLVAYLQRKIGKQTSSPIHPT
ncbi:MAG: murein biosynthesis integral membrane protein MurJ, partial [Anaerolineales bacterium]